jgi:hypothetical protein
MSAVSAIRLRTSILVVVAALALCAAAYLRAAAPAAPADSTALVVEGRANANVSLAASGPVVAAVWSASLPSGATDIFAAVSTDGGGTFAKPVRVNATAGQANVNGEQPPRVALSAAVRGGAPAITVVWTAKGPNGTQLLSARSTDGGASFGRAEPVPGGDGAGNRGWQGIAADAAGRVGVVWLDHRALADQGETVAATHHDTTHGGGNEHDGVAMAQRSHLYFAVVGDAGSLRGLTGGVCYCCKTAIAYASGNRVALAWRHVYPGNLRDIAFSMSIDGGRTFGTPVRVSEDKWQLEGCPDDGPSMAMEPSGTVHIAWPTLVSGEGGTPTIGLFYASSTNGSSFTPRVRIPTEGVPHHPQLVLGAGRQPQIVWDEVVAGQRRIAFARVSAGGGGQPVFTRRVLSGGEPSTYPMVASASDAEVVAWTAGAPASSVIRVMKVGRD